MEHKGRIDALGGAVLVVFSALLGLNQVLVKLVNDGLAPVFQAGLRSACARPAPSFPCWSSPGWRGGA